VTVDQNERRVGEQHQPYCTVERAIFYVFNEDSGKYFNICPSHNARNRWTDIGRETQTHGRQNNRQPQNILSPAPNGDEGIKRAAYCDILKMLQAMHKLQTKNETRGSDQLTKMAE